MAHAWKSIEHDCALPGVQAEERKRKTTQQWNEINDYCVECMQQNAIEIEILAAIYSDLGTCSHTLYTDIKMLSNGFPTIDMIRPNVYNIF